MAAASTDPVAALPAVSSPVVSEMSGSSALCTGRVRVIVTDDATASATTTGNSAPSSTPVPTTAQASDWAAYPSVRARAIGSRPSHAANGDARSAAGTSWTSAMMLALRTPPCS